MSLMKTVEFRNIRLEPADNGFVLEYTEVVEKPGTFEDRDYKSRQMVFGENEIDKAMAKMKELLMFKKLKKGTESAPSLKVSISG